MYFSSALQGQRESLSLPFSGAPTECSARTNSPSLPRTSRTFVPTRVMMCMFATTYGESEISTPSLAMGEPSGAMQYGMRDVVGPLGSPIAKQPHAVRDDVHRAARHRAGEEGVELHLHAGGVLPVVGGAGVVRGGRADEGAVLDAGDVAGIGADEEAVRFDRRIEGDGAALLHHQTRHLLVLLVAAVADVNAFRLAAERHLFDPAGEVGVADGSDSGRQLSGHFS